MYEAVFPFDTFTVSIDCVILLNITPSYLAIYLGNERKRGVKLSFAQCKYIKNVQEIYYGLPLVDR